jgi:hypothetical protein
MFHLPPQRTTFTLHVVRFAMAVVGVLLLVAGGRFCWPAAILVADGRFCWPVVRAEHRTGQPAEPAKNRSDQMIFASAIT